jgi:hypothetical protein
MAAHNFKDMPAGTHFGRLTIVGFSHIEHGQARWRVVCDCGRENTIVGQDLRRGHTTQCRDCANHDLTG